MARPLPPSVPQLDLEEGKNGKDVSFVRLSGMDTSFAREWSFLP